MNQQWEMAYSLPKLTLRNFYIYIEGSREGVRGHYKPSLKIYFSQYSNLHFLKDFNLGGGLCSENTIVKISDFIAKSL